MTAFIDPYSYLPQTVDIGGDIYSLGTEKPVNLGFKSRKQFLDTFGTNSKTEGLLRKYMYYSVKGKNKLVFDSPEDKTDLIEILKKRATVLKNSKGFTNSILKNEIFKRSYLYIQNLITELEGSSSKSIKVDDVACATAKKQIKDIKDDHKFQIILEMAWYLLHPDDVPSEVGCEWAKMIKQLETLRLGDIVTEIREAQTKSGIEPSKNAFNYFKKINLQTVAKSETIKNALDQAKKFASDIQGETASQDVKNRLKLLLDILEMKKYLANNLDVDEDRMKIISTDEQSNTIKRSMITNPMKGGALALNQPLGKAMNPLFDYFKVVYDPIYTFLEESIQKYRAKNENKIIIPQLTTLLHICNNLKPSNIDTDKFITYRITNVDPELLKFIKAMIGATNGKISTFSNDNDKNTFNNQLLKLPKVRLSSISDNLVIPINTLYSDPYKLPSIRFFTMKENIEYQPEISSMAYNKDVEDYFTENNIYIVYTNSENITKDIPINLYDIDYSKIDVTNKRIIISQPEDNYLVKKKTLIEDETHFENLIKIKEYSLYNDAELALSIFIALKELMPQ